MGQSVKKIDKTVRVYPNADPCVRDQIGAKKNTMLPRRLKATKWHDIETSYEMNDVSAIETQVTIEMYLRFRVMT
jgi:hypothetical protein